MQRRKVTKNRVPDFLSLAGSFHRYAKVNEGLTIDQILEREHKAVEDAFVEHYIEKEKRSGNKSPSFLKALKKYYAKDS